MEFIIKKDSERGYIISRKDGEYSQHAHIKTLNGCRQLLYLIRKGLLPKDKYLQGSARRLLYDDEYERLKKPKDKYFNKSGYNKRA